MTQGFSGGFFLPAQRSMHCKGGFFATDASAQRPQAQQKSYQDAKAKTNHNSSITAERDTPVGRRGSQNLYDDQDEDDGGIANESFEVYASGRRSKPKASQASASVPGGLHSAAATLSSSLRFIRPRYEKLTGIKASVHHPKHQQEPASKNASRLFYPGGVCEAPVRTEKGSGQRLPGKDVNFKFELAMQELNQIKGEYDLKQQRQNSAPALVFARGEPSESKTSTLASNQARPVSVQVLHNYPINLSLQREQELSQGSEAPAAVSETKTAASEEPRNLNSPRQRLQVAEMVMRKLYKKNLATEEQVTKLKDENAQLMKKLQHFGEISTAADNNRNLSSILKPPGTFEPREHIGNQGDEDPELISIVAMNSNVASSQPFVCASCAHAASSLPPQMMDLPTRESITRIDAQQLDYLRHLAAEQDKTITSLKIRIEELSSQLDAAKHQHQLSTSNSQQHASGRNGKSSTPRQIVNRLQSKLQDALSESERQKSNYVKMKKDFQHLLGLKTKTLVENPTQLNASARELLQLMERKLSQIEGEHSQNLSLYNCKLYEVEQQTCESYVQQKLMEQEVARIAQDVQQRDDVDVQIEQCMVGVFERLRQVEMENILLKTAPLPATSMPANFGAATE